MIHLNFKKWLEVQLPQAVLVIIGAFNPIHRGHVRAAYNAKRFIEIKSNMDIVKGYMVPKNQDYVNKKAAQKGETPVPQEYRLKAVELALHGSFIEMLTIDCDFGPLTDMQIKSYVQELHPDKEVIMVVGDDYIQCPNNEKPPCLVHNDYGTELVNFREKGVSSTAARSGNLSILPPQVLNFAKSKHLWGVK